MAEKSFLDWSGISIDTHFHRREREKSTN
ncbi:unnamed protein product [Aspergillus niger]|uniref:Contig An16c0200, genomic contig n=1 Tax=Aspergillus niger (strain ATCC MYA-4892 / CBS 513.88 / FGSC A1513) TaxID=425011 RepID=A2R892_ASPNC|nr:unnamed protein product [Aspergillus niger]